MYDHGRYHLENSWRWPIDAASTIIIDSGWLNADPDQGFAWFRLSTTTKLTAADIRNGVHLTPTKTGGLKIVGADGHMVKLLSTSGVEWVFDAEQGRFVTPVEEPLPTATPMPTPRPTPVIMPVERLLIDADPAGNTAASWGAIDGCREAEEGKAVTVDVIMDGLPDVDGAAMGVIAFDFRVVYDAAVVRVTAIDVDQLLSEKANSFVTSVGDAPPDTDGSLHVTAVDSGPTGGDVRTISETTGGVLVRVTLEAVGSGVSEIGITGVGIIDTRNDAHAVSQVIGAKIAAGSAC
jgi:hypothetical protein